VNVTFVSSHIKPPKHAGYPVGVIGETENARLASGRMRRMAHLRMMPKSGYRFSEKIMRQQDDRSAGTAKLKPCRSLATPFNHA
jgi:hypothetical protein